MSRKLKFIIISETRNEKVGASIVLHRLAEILSDYGDEVLITSPPKSEKVFNFYDKINEISNINEYIVICTENIDLKGYKNPVKNCRNVVRWILYNLGYFKMAFSEIPRFQGYYDYDDRIYQFSKYFTKGSIYENSKELTVFDPKYEIFNNRDQDRLKGDCILLKKGKYKGNNIPGTLIDDLIEKEDNEKFDDNISRVFNEHQRFISYDTSSFHSVQAALCGCLSIVIPDEGVSKEVWLENQPLMEYGIAYGFDDIQWALSTQHLVKGHLEEYNNRCLKSIDDFRNDCLINFPDEDHISVIIQTRWQTSKILKLLKGLDNSPYVNEIILIDDNPRDKMNISEFNKIKYINSEEPYPNKSINKSVKICSNNLICLCDDSIEFDHQDIFDWVFRNKHSLGCIGLNPISFYYQTNLTGAIKVESREDVEKLIKNGFGKLVFFDKKSFIKIPEDLRFNYGVDWICKTNKPIYSLTTRQRILKHEKSQESEHPQKYKKILSHESIIWSRINQSW